MPAGIRSPSSVPSSRRLEALLLGAVHGRGRADPVLGHAFAPNLLAAQLGDARTAAVEALDRIGRQRNWPHSVDVNGTGWETAAREARLVPPHAVAVRSLARPPARAAERSPGRCAALGQARRLQQRAGLRRQQDAQARVPGGRSAGHGMRHPGLDRRSAVQPHAPGGGGGRAARPARRAGPGELGRVAGRGLRPGWQHPAQPSDGRRRAPRALGVRHRLQGELGAGHRRHRGGRRHALRHPGRRLGPPARRPGLRALGAGGGRAGGRSSACSSTRSSSARSPAAPTRA